jgi:hypothetical protein
LALGNKNLEAAVIHINALNAPRAAVLAHFDFRVAVHPAISEMFCLRGDSWNLLLTAKGKVNEKQL